MEPAAFLVHSLKTQYKCLSVKLMEQRVCSRLQGTDPEGQNPCYKLNLIVRVYRFSYTLPNTVIYEKILLSYKP